MRRKFLGVLVFASLFAALYASSGFAAVSVFATGTNSPETITQTASGSFFVTDADAVGDIWNVPAAGGTASSVAQAGFTLRGGLSLPGSFGAVGRLATFSSVSTPFGAAVAPSGFGAVGGTLLVSDAGGSGIYSVDPAGNVSLFTTIPLSAGQGLRQIAFAPTGWGLGTGNLF